MIMPADITIDHVICDGIITSSTEDPEELKQIDEHQIDVCMAWLKQIDEHQIDVCMAWLEEFAKPKKSIKQGISSYSYKHVVEEWCSRIGKPEYISNGAFIVAAIRLGYRAVRGIHANDPNAYFNIGANFKRDRLR